VTGVNLGLTKTPKAAAALDALPALSHGVPKQTQALWVRRK